jgi:hypothetical protein
MRRHTNHREPEINADPAQKMAATYAEASHAFADGLRAIPWPAGILPDAKVVIKNAATIEADFIAASQAKTRNEAIADINRGTDLANRAGSAAANLLRGDLGVQSVGGSCPK